MVVWELIREAMTRAHQRGLEWLTVGEIIREVHKTNPAAHDGTIGLQVKYHCINDPTKRSAPGHQYRRNPLFVTSDPKNRGKSYRLLTEGERLAFLSNPRDDLDEFTYAQAMALLGQPGESAGPSLPPEGRKEDAATSTRAQTTMAGRLGEVLLLIPCCGEKQGTGPQPQTASAPLCEELSRSSCELLWAGRRAAFSQACTSLDVTSALLPAITWYTGRPYSVPGFHEALNGALQRGLRCLVVSGGYGLLRLDKPIHRYNAQMTKTRTVWRVRLPTILRDYVTGNDVRRVFGALSTAYYDAVGPDRWGPVEADTWWYVPRFRRGLDPGAAMTEVPKAVAQSVIGLIQADFAPGPEWRRG